MGAICAWRGGHRLGGGGSRPELDAKLIRKAAAVVVPCGSGFGRAAKLLSSQEEVSFDDREKHMGSVL